MPADSFLSIIPAANTGVYGTDSHNQPGEHNEKALFNEISAIEVKKALPE